MKNILLLIMFFYLTTISVKAENTIVRVETTLGEFKVELFNNKAPKTVKNFLNYVRSEFYNGLIFHRVIDGFMIQGGGFDTEFNRKETFTPITNEADNLLKNSLGSIAMARTSDPHSATAQFFINTNNNHFLNYKNKTTRGYGYAVFGEVIEGYSVIKKIEKSETGANGPFPKDAPLSTIEIKKITEIGEK